jgi:hypothetical protein
MTIFDGHQYIVAGAPLLRRLLGKELIQTFCHTSRPRCQGSMRADGVSVAASELCSMATSCPYGILFAKSLTTRAPFALYLKSTSTGELNAITLEVTLYGPAVSLYPWVLAAFCHTFDKGLGAEPLRYALVGVEKAKTGNEHFTWGEYLMGTPSSPILPSMLNFAAGPRDQQLPIAIHLLSTTRIADGQRLLKQDCAISFDVLVARILDRYHDLYGSESAPAIEGRSYQELIEQAKGVPLLKDQSKWLNVLNYSGYLRRSYWLGGKVGTLIYGPEANSFWPLLKIGEVLHVGKNAPSGCGRFEAVQQKTS